MATSKKIPTYSLVGESYLGLGALATPFRDTTQKAYARRIALNIEETLLVANPKNLPIYYEPDSKVVINMKAARALGLSPSFDVLDEAIVLNRDRTANQVYSLNRVVRLAVERNLQVVVQKLAYKQEDARLGEVRGALLPQLNSTLSYFKREEGSGAVESGFAAETSSDASLRVDQVLFSDKLWAAYTIQKYQRLSTKELLRQTELDITQAAAVSYLQVLLAKATLNQKEYNLEITNENLRLARNRVSSGISNKSDLYRWESEAALAKSEIFSARATLNTRKQNLNRILNEPIDSDFKVSEETLENPMLLISDSRVKDLIQNERDLQKLTRLFVKTGLEMSPELKRIDADLKAVERREVSNLRSFFVPDVSVYGQYSMNLDETRTASALGLEAEKNDWAVGLNLTFPLFEGGARFKRYEGTGYARLQLKSQYENGKLTIENNVRNSMESVHATYMSIQLAKKAESAAESSYKIVKNTYKRGKSTIVDLLNIQEVLISAREGSARAVYSFLVELVNLQRSIGQFDFFLTDQERNSISIEIMKEIKDVERR